MSKLSFFVKKDLVVTPLLNTTILVPDGQPIQDLYQKGVSVKNYLRTEKPRLRYKHHL
jgi:hypothetical protein